MAIMNVLAELHQEHDLKVKQILLPLTLVAIVAIALISLKSQWEGHLSFYEHFSFGDVYALLLPHNESYPILSVF